MLPCQLINSCSLTHWPDHPRFRQPQTCCLGTRCPLVFQLAHHNCHMPTVCPLKQRRLSSAGKMLPQSTVLASSAQMLSVHLILKAVAHISRLILLWILSLHLGELHSLQSTNKVIRYFEHHPRLKPSHYFICYKTILSVFLKQTHTLISSSLHEKSTWTFCNGCFNRRIWNCF